MAVLRLKKHTTAIDEVDTRNHKGYLNTVVRCLMQVSRRSLEATDRLPGNSCTLCQSGLIPPEKCSSSNTLLWRHTNLNFYLMTNIIHHGNFLRAQATCH
ncbi:Uncharacterised protein [Acinetobacter baumannii]|nr:Uncharacterised protein [Acinetobacter baumannii]